ncbi:MAG: glycosyltransferase family 2 protein [Prevotella sp.]|nr:glycosyltransferase family 2 protein [Prevotella sp.]
MQYEVTIGIPVYRAVDYIEKTMESALAQTFSSIEYLVINDGSLDGSIDIVERLQHEHPRGNDIRILYNKQNSGVGVTRNRILDEAKGRYIYFLDSDDLIEPDTIQSMHEKIDERQADVVYGSLDRVDMVKDSPIQSYVLPDVFLSSDDEMALYAFKNYSSFQISVCNCLMNVEFLRSNRLRFIDAIFWEDLAFTYEMVTKVRRAVLLSKITYHYLCRPDSLSHYQDRELLNKTEIMDNVSVLDYLKGKSKEIGDKIYLPDYCYNLEMNSFYVVCYILKYYQRISPAISYSVMRSILSYPLGIMEILRFRHKLFENLFFWVLSHLPSFLFIFVVKLFGKIKKAI